MNLKQNWKLYFLPVGYGVIVGLFCRFVAGWSIELSVFLGVAAMGLFILGELKGLRRGR